jgi:hypothetical protein
VAKGNTNDILDKDEMLQLFGCLSRMNFSQSNFFADDDFRRFKTAEEFKTDENGHSFLPYTLEDIAHQATQIIDAGMAPEKVFAVILDKDGFQLVRALAFTIAQQVEKKAKTAKVGK